VPGVHYGDGRVPASARGPNDSRNGSDLRQDAAMAERWQAGDWTVQVVHLAVTPDRRDGEWLRVCYCGWWVADVRSVADLERWFPLASLEEDTLAAAHSHPSLWSMRPITVTRPLPYWTAAAVAAALVLAGCGGASGSQSSTPGTQAPSATAAATPAAAPTPDTAAEAQTAAENLFALYAAGQYTAVYPMLSAQTRATVPEHKWVAVHEDCLSAAAGLSYKVGKPVMAGQTAVMSVSLAGAASAVGSEEESFVYQDGGWFWAPSAANMSASGNYKGTVARIVASLKAAGFCG
jgi:hypothetical protein